MSCRRTNKSEANLSALDVPEAVEKREAGWILVGEGVKGGQAINKLP